MKPLIAIVLAACVGTTFAADGSKLAAKRKAREELIAKLGGVLARKDKEPGILFLNCQKTVPTACFEQTLLTIRHEFRVSCFLREGEFKDFEALISMANDSKHNACVIAIVDNAKFPQLLCAPDNRVAVVNVRPLMADKPVPEKLAQRSWLMAYRGFGVVMGGAWSSQRVGLMRPAETLAELDAISGRASAPDAHFPIDAFCRARKVATGGITSYRDACVEGWAPAPTNDVQKAIWDGVKSGKIKDE